MGFRYPIGIILLRRAIPFVNEEAFNKINRTFIHNKVAILAVDE